MSGRNLFAGAWRKGVFLSPDKGDNWSVASTDLSGEVVWSLAAKPACGGSGDTNIFAGCGTGGVFLSTNTGASWGRVDSGLTGTEVHCLAAIDTIIFVGTWGNGVFRSTNDGTRWEEASDGLTNLEIVSFIVDGANLFAGTSGGVFLSTDYGATWTQVNDGLRNTAVQSLASTSTLLFAGTTKASVWSRPLSEMANSVISPSGLHPTAFSLGQNYPNPFNPVTKIQFTIVDRQLTIVNVYDLMGREVATLVNEVKEPGTYAVQFDGSNLASGVYLYRLTAGSFVQTRKMIVVK
jgi:hypothetical protein